MNALLTAFIGIVITRNANVIRLTTVLLVCYPCYSIWAELGFVATLIAAEAITAIWHVRSAASNKLVDVTAELMLVSLFIAGAGIGWLAHAVFSVFGLPEYFGYA